MRRSNNFGSAFVIGVAGALVLGGLGGVAVAEPAHTEPAEADVALHWPLSSINVTSPYGPRKGPRGSFHHGIDLGAPAGTPVYAAAAGKVTKADGTSDPHGYGNWVIVNHPGGKETYYAHLSKIEVAVNEQVSQGQEIGLVGETGDAVGPHLHFEVRQGGKDVDPAKGEAARVSLLPTDTSSCSKSKAAAHECWDSLINQYDWDDANAFNVMWCESTGNPNARNPEAVKTGAGMQHAIGLFQILDGPTDPVANVKLAHEIYAKRGWQPWVCKG